MKLNFTTVDVFTSTRYAGNPLAIVHVPGSFRGTLTNAQKQAIAKEFNLSETVFMHSFPPPPVQPSSSPYTITPILQSPGVSQSGSEDNGKTPDADTIEIDIYTPHSEIPFAGHPTIGSAWYVLTHPDAPPSFKNLKTKAGPIPVSRSSIDTKTSLIRAEIPHDIHVHTNSISTPINLIAKAATSAIAAGHPIVSIVKGMSFILCELPDLETLAHATTAMVTDCYDVNILDPEWQQGLIGTLYYVSTGRRGGSGTAGAEGPRKEVQTFRTRMHVEWTEDPATGSASCAFAAYMAMQESLTAAAGGPGSVLKYELTQGVEMGRKSDIGVEVSRDASGAVEKVWLSGTAVKVMDGVLEV